MATSDRPTDISALKPPAGAKHKRKRIGRGEGSGTGVTAGRGHKGQQSRSGYSRKRGFEGGQMPIHRRLPKRGFHNPFRIAYDVVNLDTLEARFEAGAEVTPVVLRERGLIGKRALVKVLARGELSKKLIVKAHRFSAQASKAIAAAGGRAEVLAAGAGG
jgi:large subunit ribosomal protein L15